MNTHTAAKWLDDLLFEMEELRYAFYLPEHARAIEFAIERMTECDNRAPPPKPTTTYKPRHAAGNTPTVAASLVQSPQGKLFEPYHDG